MIYFFFARLQKLFLRAGANKTTIMSSKILWEKYLYMRRFIRIYSHRCGKHLQKFTFWDRLRHTVRNLSKTNFVVCGSYLVFFSKNNIKKGNFVDMRRIYNSMRRSGMHPTANCPPPALFWLLALNLTNARVILEIEPFAYFSYASVRPPVRLYVRLTHNNFSFHN